MMAEISNIQHNTVAEHSPATNKDRGSILSLDVEKISSHSTADTERYMHYKV
jgi:hypothetical protein